jgi:hypothetical protein
MWPQSHKAEVLAQNKKDAKAIATCLHDRNTLEGVHNITVREVSK